MTTLYKSRLRMWVEALRSGDYKQTRDALKKHGSYCCLGVACEVFKKNTGEGAWEKAHEQDSALYFVCEGVPKNKSDWTAFLPGRVAEWFGLVTTEGYPVRDPRLVDYFHASNLNDKGITFSEIAELIEKRYHL